MYDNELNHNTNNTIKIKIKAQNNNNKNNNHERIVRTRKLWLNDDIKELL